MHMFNGETEVRRKCAHVHSFDIHNLHQIEKEENRTNALQKLSVAHERHSELQLRAKRK